MLPPIINHHAPFSPDFLEERVFPLQAVVLAGPNIHVAVCLGAMLCRKSVAITVVSIDSGHVVAQHHDMVALLFCVFFAYSVIVLDGVKIA